MCYVNSILKDGEIKETEIRSRKKKQQQKKKHMPAMIIFYANLLS